MNINFFWYMISKLYFSKSDEIPNLDTILEKVRAQQPLISHEQPTYTKKEKPGSTKKQIENQ